MQVHDSVNEINDEIKEITYTVKRPVIKGGPLMLLNKIAAMYGKSCSEIAKIVLYFAFDFWELSQFNLNSKLIFINRNGEENTLDFIRDIAKYLPELTIGADNSISTSISIRLSSRDLKTLDMIKKSLDLKLSEVIERALVFYDRYLKLSTNGGKLVSRVNKIDTVLVEIETSLEERKKAAKKVKRSQKKQSRVGHQQTKTQTPSSRH